MEYNGLFWLCYWVIPYGIQITSAQLPFVIKKKPFKYIKLNIFCEIVPSQKTSFPKDWLYDCLEIFFDKDLNMGTVKTAFVLDVQKFWPKWLITKPSV